VEITLVVLSGPDEGKQHAFSNPTTIVVGRSPSADLVLAGDPEVAEQHAVLKVHPPHVYLRDLDGPVSTEVNRRKVSIAKLRSFDTIKCGQTYLLLKTAPGSDEAPATAESAHCLGPGCQAVPSAASADGRVNDFYCVRCRNAILQNPPLPAGLRYVGQLGEGGMGVVVRALHEDLGIARAVKLLVPSERFALMQKDGLIREGLLLAKLDHPRVVRVHDFQEVLPSVFCTVMDLFEGKDAGVLAAERQGAGLDPRAAIAIALGALEGLIYTHSQGIVHRDLKPGNILVATDASGAVTAVKLADYGFAKHWWAAGGSNITDAGQLAVSAGYTAPEQITDYRHTKPAADVFAMAATFYRLLTGKAIYDLTPTDQAVTAGLEYAKKVLREDIVPMRQRDPGVPAAVAVVVEQALSKEPASRPSAEELKQQLEAAAKSAEWV